MDPIRSLAFVVNEEKDGAAELGDLLSKAAASRGVAVRLTAEFPLRPGYFQGCDACCVIGGDGTLLGVVTEAVRENIPIIGVNRGSLGFLTTFAADEARAHFDELLAGSFEIAERSLLECRIEPAGTYLALNDVLIKDEFSSRLVRLEVHADDELVTGYNCDGLIFSTPTGSTAYNLSAGGPLIHPESQVIAMTPICPHTLSNRSIIFRHDVKLRVHHRHASPRLLIAMDGQRNVISCENSPIEISVAKERVRLAQRRDYSHFAVVRTKLKWSGGYGEAQRS